MTNHDAIYILYPSVVTILGETAYDINGNEVVYDKSAINSKMESLSYVTKRVAEYPDFKEYLDGIVKGDIAQLNAYISACQAVKAKYPK
jgi:hypothetical protein